MPQYSFAIRARSILLSLLFWTPFLLSPQAALCQSPQSNSGVGPGITVDFDDLTVGDMFSTSPPDNTFRSAGVLFSIVDAPNQQTFQGTGFISDGSFASSFPVAPFSGNYLFFNNQVGLAVDLAPATQALSFSYAFGYDVTIAVNGNPVFAEGDILQFDGTTIDGVRISIASLADSEPFPRLGTVRLWGDIDHFAVTGTELAIDNFSTAVPEPSGAVLLGIGGLGFLARRKRALLHSKTVNQTSA